MLRTPLLRFVTIITVLFMGGILLPSSNIHAASTDLAPAPPPNVIHISSYDNSYSWNYDIVQKIHTTLNENHVDVQTFYLDSHHLTPEQLIERGKHFRDIILTQKPDVIIATDDAAAQYVIHPYFLDNKIPVVFAGINWDASEYNFPATNVTGIIEVSPTIELFHAMNRIVKKDMETVRIAFIAPDTFTQQKNIYYETKITGKQYNEIYLVKTLDDMKQAYIKAQENNDYIYMNNIAGIDGWNEKDVLDFIHNNTIKPSCGNISTLGAYALLTFAKFPEEQANWAVRATLDIIFNGTSPADIPVVTNTKAKIILNNTLAEKLKVKIPRDILELSVSVP